MLVFAIGFETRKYEESLIFGFIVICMGIMGIALKSLLLFKRLGEKYYFSFPTLYWIMISPIIIYNLIELFKIKTYDLWKVKNFLDFLSIFFRDLIVDEGVPLIIKILIYIGVGYILGGVCYRLKIKNLHLKDTKGGESSWIVKGR